MDCKKLCDVRSDIATAEALYQAARYDEAYRGYAKAMIVFASIRQEDIADAQGLVEEVQLPCLLRLAACKVKLRTDLDKALAHCNACLTLCPASAKAYLRRAQVNMQLNKYDSAAKDLISAAKLENGSKAIQQTWMQLKLLQNKQKVLKPIEHSVWLDFVKGLALLIRSYFS